MNNNESISVTIAPGKRGGEVSIPSSKSAAHRLLICAALGQGRTELLVDGLSKDILATAACLRSLGADVEEGPHGITVTPIKETASDALLPCGESGSTLRFLLPVAGALGMAGCFQMEGRLPERPMRAFEEVLCAHGMRIAREGDRLLFGGRLQSGEYRLPGDVSSQYFSGLLMALPLLPGDSTLTAEGKLESAGYIRMTEDALALSGVRIKRDGNRWEIPRRQRFKLPDTLRAEGDWSNAAFFLCMGALSERDVTVRGLNLKSSQGDMAVLDILEHFGAAVTADAAAGSVTVRRGESRPLIIDAAPIPDLVPVLSILTCGAEGESRIENAARLRLKESDRLQSTAALIRALGGKAEELPDGLIIRGAGALTGGMADPCGDHRIAMSAAAAACICTGPVTVQNARCVQKSYPNFWEDFASLKPEQEV